MSRTDTRFYQLAWRWHFYAGLFVAPFMILLALTGIVYLFKPQLDPLLYPQLLLVEPAGAALDADRQLDVLRASHPRAQVTRYFPPAAAERSALFVVEEDGRSLNLFVDPYRGVLLGAQDARYNLQALARGLHGELLAGPLGDRLIELAAGWGIVLLASGLYLGWPRGRGLAGVLWPRWSRRGRALWRDLHVSVGVWSAALLLFLLLSGMAWTGFWGKQFADLWNRFPAAMWQDVPQSGREARSLSDSTRQAVPWAVENTPLPASDPHAAHHGHAGGHAEAAAPRIGLQQVVELAAARGVVPGYGVSLPRDARGVYSVSIFADDPRDDATLHIDQYSGAVLADVRWRDYNWLARTVESGAMLHEGRMFGRANQLLMLAACLAVLFGACSGLLIWWQRRPRGSLGVPPLRPAPPRWKAGLALVVLLGALFPLVGASLLLCWLGECLLRALRRAAT